MENYNKENNEVIDIAKGIAIISVVMGHLIQYSLSVIGEDFYQNYIFKIIYSFHMPLFIFISGYLLFYSVSRKSINIVFESKIRRLAIPYIVWVSFDICLELLENINGSNITIKFIAELIMKKTILYPSIWFLYTLIILTFLILSLVILEKKIGKWSYYLMLIGIYIFPNSSHFDIYFIKWFYLFFMLGFIYNKNNLFESRWYNHKTTLISLTILFFSMLIFWSKSDYIYNNKMYLLKGEYLYSLIKIGYRYLVGLIGIVIIFKLSGYINRIKAKKVLIKLGKYSLDIYLLQRYIIEVGFYKLYSVIYAKTNYKFNYISLCIIGCLIICIIMMISSKVIRKNKKIRRLLLGMN